MIGMTLEVQLDLPLLDSDIEAYDEFVAAGNSPYEAARAVAQNLLGSAGAIVQSAEAVPS